MSEASQRLDPTGSGGIPIENIEQTDQFKRLKLREPTKEATARTLAMVLVWSFAAALLCSFVIGTYVLAKSPAVDDKSLAASTEFIKVTSSIFTPLLAFVLGYYFSKRQE
ncbi:MAG: hypothetical protein ACLQOO_26730 [Terriglobia bacterium]